MKEAALTSVAFEVFASLTLISPEMGATMTRKAWGAIKVVPEKEP